ncbi:MAG: prepilin peptidase [Patescibacteria group bacterium]
MEIFLILVIGALGLAVGSFINAAVYRLRIREFRSLLWGRSFCPSCKKTLAARDLVPLLSFLWLKGKCRFCKKKIGSHYFWVELATAVAFLLTATFGPCGTGALLWNLFFVSVLIFLASFDAQFGEIPDEVAWPTAAIALLGSILVFAPGLPAALLGALVGGGFFTIIVLASNGKWMGGGDIRLGLILGLLLGWRGFAAALFIASLTGSLVGVYEIYRGRKKFKSPMPFAPFLAGGGIIALLFAEKIWTWYLGLLFQI